MIHTCSHKLTRYTCSHKLTRYIFFDSIKEKKKPHIGLYKIDPKHVVIYFCRSSLRPTSPKAEPVLSNIN